MKYADYETEWIPEGNTLRPFVYKRHSFQFEQELRACVQIFPIPRTPGGDAGGIDFTIDSPPGLPVDVDLDVLVEAIHVSPSKMPRSSRFVDVADASR